MEAQIRRIARGALLAVLAPGINGCGGWADGDRDARTDAFGRAEIHDVSAAGLDAGAFTWEALIPLSPSWSGSPEWHSSEPEK